MISQIHTGTDGNQNFIYVPTAVNSAIAIVIQPIQYVQPMTKPAFLPRYFSTNPTKVGLSGSVSNNSPNARIIQNMNNPVMM